MQSIPNGLYPRAYITIAIFFIVSLFYAWTALSNGSRYDFYKVNYYNALSEAFLAGKTSLLIEPRKELLSLSDPYDAKQNYFYRLHDAALYQNKYYLYFGPVPALLLFIPYHIITNNYLSNPVAITLFSAGGFFWTLLLLNFCVKKWFQKISAWMHGVAGISLGLCNIIPFLLRRPAVYEVAISSGFFFLMGFSYWLITSVLDNKFKPWKLLTASLFLGLAIGSRINLIVITITLPFWFFFFIQNHQLAFHNKLRALFYFISPLIICLISLGIYNEVRFNSWSEFGNSYLLTGTSIKHFSFLQLKNIFPGIYLNLFLPTMLDHTFPFFHLVTNVELGGYKIEAIAGILGNIYFANLIFIFPLLMRDMKKNDNGLLVTVSGLLISGILLLIFLSFLMASASIRYQVDFITFILLPALLIWFYLDTVCIKLKTIKYMSRIVMVILIAYSIFYNLSISMTGYNDLLKYSDNRAYENIRAYVCKIIICDNDLPVKGQLPLPLYGHMLNPLLWGDL